MTRLNWHDLRKRIRKILAFFAELETSLPSFEWDHAKAAESKEVSQKVLAKIAGKNLFIGICTKKEQVLIEQAGILRRLRPRYEWKPSDWVIQEVGLAVGREMKVIILLESGVRKPGDLQGNVEYIPFFRDKVEACFIQLLQMIRSISPSYSAAATPSSSEVTSSAAADQEDRVTKINWEEPDPNWDAAMHRVAAIFAIEKSNDSALAEIADAYIAKFGQTDDAKAEWSAFVESYQITLGTNGGSLDRLKALYIANPRNADVASAYARTLLKFDNYEMAAKIYKEAAAHVRESSAAIRCLGDAAMCWQKAGDVKMAAQVANEMIAASVGGDAEIELLRALAQYFKSSDDKELQLPALDRLLELDPTDTDARFSLAYTCFELGMNNLSFYQYSRIPEAQRSSTTWNNLGVASQENKMPIEAVRAYTNAVELSDTLAMSNMARVYLRAGLVEEAKSC
jgi:tetratricopeptide (TPR) repeat protein